MSAGHMIELPDELFRDVSHEARQTGSSPQEWVAQVLSERFRLQRQTEEFFRERAKGASDRTMRELLDKAPDVPPMPGDELPEELRAKFSKSR